MKQPHISDDFQIGPEGAFEIIEEPTSMQVSHELPLCLLNKGEQWNDYDFCLPTYWFKYKAYREYFIKAKQNKRFIILDNGLFEGDSFTQDELIKLINELEPDIFVIPDVWNDAEQSYRNAKYWKNVISHQLPKNTKLMAVIQCTDFDIGSKLYLQYIDLGIKHIAFNHSSTAYQDFFPHENLSISKMMGRIYFINKLKKQNIIDEQIYHHLLGCSIPDELKYYGEGYKFIKSVDSSNPVVWGCKGHSYDEKITSIEKPKEKIEEFFDKNLDYFQKELILDNIRKFRNYLK